MRLPRKFEWVRWVRLAAGVLGVIGCVATSAAGAELDSEGNDVLFGAKLQQRAEEFHKPVVIRFDGEINLKTSKFLKNRIGRAKSVGADLLIVEINSPGGMAFESIELAELLRDIDWAYTIAYIPREAISGAALISLGCDEIILGPTGRIGDVGVIQFDSQVFAFRYVPAKVISVFARHAQDLASAKGRPKELAEAMVDKDVVVFQKKDAAEGRPVFKTVRLENEDQNALEAAKNSGLDVEQWGLVEESGPQRFLTLNSTAAVRLGLADSVIESRESLLESMNATGAVVEYNLNMTDEIVYWLNTLLVTALLIIVGLIALYVEFSAPGIGAGGLVAGLCAALFFWSRFMGGTSGWLELILFFAGILFLIMEVFVIPGWGISGLMGLVMIFGSVLMASQEFVIPESGHQWSQMTSSLLVLSCSGCIVLIGAVLISRRLGTIPVFNRLILQRQPGVTEIDGEQKGVGKPLPPVHPVVSIGDWGVTESLLRPAGRVLFAGQSFDVVSDGEFVEPGIQVRVLEISGNRIVVSRVDPLDDTVAHGDESS